jgi:TRAP-type C4-dicarboxylate transport system permease small subunit
MEPIESLWPGLAAGRDFTLVLSLLIALAIGVRAWLFRRDRERWERIGRRLEESILALLLGTIVILSALQIAARNFFDAGYIWIDPLLRSLVLWITFLGALAATSRGRHIAIDVVSRLLPHVGRRVLSRATFLIAGLICLALANAGYEYIGLEREFETHAFLGLPTWVVQIILPSGFALLAFRFLADAILGPKDRAESDFHGETPHGDAA